MLEYVCNAFQSAGSRILSLIRSVTTVETVFIGHETVSHAMFVRRGPASTVVTDREATASVLDRVARTGEAGLRVWYPHRQVAFGRRDENAAGYDAACAAASDRGYPVSTREVGGRAVAFTGGTLAFVHATPVDGPRGGIGSRYGTAIATLRDAIAACGVETSVGEPDGAFCPGTHSLSTDGGKIAGLAQRVTDAVATVAGAVVVTDREDFVDVTAAVYEALDVPFDPAATDSIAAAGGPRNHVRVADAVVAAFVA